MRNFAGIAELWFNNEMTDSAVFTGGADTVAFVIKQQADDIERLKRDYDIPPASQTFWFDSTLVDSEKEELLSDFKEWSGGFEPSECDEEHVMAYVESALSEELDKNAATVHLLNCHHSA